MPRAAAQSPIQIERQIAALQARLAQARKGAGKVIAKIKKDVAKYGITAEDIFGAAKEVASTAAAAMPAAVKAKIPAKYTDGTNAWSGRGAQPRWLRAAISEGKKVEDFLIGTAKKVTKAIKAKAAPAKKAATKVAPKAVKKAAPVKKAAAVKPAAKKAVAPVASTKAPAPKKVAVKKAAPKPAAKKSAAKPKKAASAKVASEQASPAAAAGDKA